MEYNQQKENYQNEKKIENLEKTTADEEQKNSNLLIESNSLSNKLQSLKHEEERLNSSIIRDKEAILRELIEKNEYLKSEVIKKIIIFLINFFQ